MEPDVPAPIASELVDWVYEQLQDQGVDDETALVVVAALEGEAQLDAVVEERTVARQGVDRAVQVSATPGGAFLTSIEVEGFRGIGATTTLSLKPRPGLTIVAGRNGSGKSSLAEALELALTGDTYRWRNKSAAWSQRWRNLHHGTARIKIAAVEEDRGPVSIVTSWPDDEAELRRRTTRTQRTVDGRVQAQQDGLGDLGWERPLEQFRPILSYDELGGILEQEPSRLYDALASILGVEQIADALNRVQVRLKKLKEPQAAVARGRRELRDVVAQVDDDRAAQAAVLLAKTSPDVAALRRLATGGEGAAGPVRPLRDLAQVSAPATADQVTAAAQAIRTAVAAVADSAQGPAAADLARLDLLDEALRLHSDHGDMSCPVCRQGTLDGTWARTSRQLVDQARQQLVGYEQAKRGLESARQHLRRIVVPPPEVLRTSPLPQTQAVVDRARTAWEDYAVDLAGTAGTGIAADLAAAAHAEQRIGPLLDALEQVRSAAAAEAERLDDVWRPLASRIAAWCGAWDEVAAGRSALDRLTRAEKWLKDNDLMLKNQRLRPLADGARRAWLRLRQESNVEIGSLTLEGASTRRRVQIAATVDGTAAGSIEVLSQGELHALALSLFIPRATMAASPFRFVVLDDPVQAMDPAKVDGLVDLLSELARERQVIVLTHDDRLPAAVRRSSIDATVLEVSRGKSSRVLIRLSTDPAQRYLDDAFGLVKECDAGRVPDSAVRRTLPGLLRFSVEAVAKDRYFGTALSAGRPLAEVEQSWQDARSARERVALAIGGASDDASRLETWIAGRDYRRHALNHVGRAMHNGLKPGIAPGQAVTDVRRLVADIRSTR